MARAQSELDNSKLQKVVAVVRKLKGDIKDSAKFDAIVEAIKVARPMAARYLYAAEVVIDPKLKFKLTTTNYKKAKATGLREERIAARSGVSMAQLAAFKADNSVESVYSGKGRRFDGSKPEKKPAAKPRATANKGAKGAKAAKETASSAKAKKGGNVTKTRRRSDLTQRP